MTDAAWIGLQSYEPREFFRRFHARTQRWAVMVAHRRCGKTVACVADLVMAALFTKKQDARFAYVAPQFNQAKDIAWLYVKRLTSDLPGVVYNETELRADFPNGARVRLYGAENADRMRGLFLDGIIMDEFADMSPSVWGEVIRPLLADRQGWGVFIGTPRGHNSFYDIWKDAQGNQSWFSLMIKASESGVLPPAEIEEMRGQLSDDQAEQELECSFQAAVVGSYYGREMSAALDGGRIGKVDWEPSISVDTAWDLGMSDSTAIICAQRVGNEIRIIDFIEHSGVGLDWYVNQLRSRPYTWGEHILPHDAQVKELGTGKSRIETLHSLGLGSARVIPAQSVADGINAVRLVLPRCWFDSEKADRLIESLRNYRREYDEKRKVYHDRPLHDWCSHASDAMRYLAQGLPQKSTGWDKPLSYRTGWVV